MGGGATDAFSYRIGATSDLLSPLRGSTVLSRLQRCVIIFYRPFRGSIFLSRLQRCVIIFYRPFGARGSVAPPALRNNLLSPLSGLDISVAPPALEPMDLYPS